MTFSNAQNIRFHLKVVWKPFSKILLIKDFSFHYFSTFFPAFPRNSFNSVIQKFAKSRKCYFQTLRTFFFYLKGALKSFSKMVPSTKFWFKQTLLCFPRKRFQLRHTKYCKKWEIIILKRFWLQSSFKTIFNNASYEKLCIEIVLKV